ncbi:LolA family protein [Luteimicrobium subarcticum]|uniref:Outer membrane lipoprotein-sorting protein n=1 Tax=Luteimicrobium subarcticum TaxID=620910 RepID=A0A2M8W6Z6_9MICO|nr:hypothetical protein [Luteimicrobium subarcticum]PJI86701.1 outer membrane lipoprotein-sorting protein [Luteimicrobium subarcticum]
MSIFDRRPALRWAVPVAAAALVGAVAVGTSTVASADDHPDLPAVSAQDLLVDLASPTTPSVQGTVEATMRLGLPDLSGVPGLGGGPVAGGSSASVLAGTHTLRVWSDGPGRSRVAVLGGQSETDVVRDGTDVWLWDSAARSATHVTLPAERAGVPSATGGVGPTLTPDAAARAALGAVDPGTVVATDDTARVAGRPAYTLTLTPKPSERTLVREVAVDVDAATHVPLRVRVWSVEQSKPAVDVGFTDVSFATPPASTFDFTPPAGATVKTVPLRAGAGAKGSTRDAQDPTVVGDGWDAVAVGTLDDDQLAALTGDGSTTEVLDQLPTASGAWGSGHVLRGTLFSAVLTDDGRVAVGAVPVDVLTGALASAPQG